MVTMGSRAQFKKSLYADVGVTISICCACMCVCVCVCVCVCARACVHVCNGASDCASDHVRHLCVLVLCARARV